ncbi:MAG TPA: PP2C family serine/threonine-protein phosphatase [Terriglobia bacterium]|nr:PP2C family serine/threonine-protein phosphatase [Terriglobia bacterium]
MSFPVECYGASRPQQGRTANEDAFWIGREPFPVVVVCDGAGNAQQSAQRAITFFQKLWASGTPDQIRAADTWGKWIHLLDSHLMGLSQSTFLGIAVLEDCFVGAYAGDSRIFHSTADGTLRLLTDSTMKLRLGSGQAKPAFLTGNLQARDLLVLMTDGAWGPLGSLSMTQRAIVKGIGRHLSDVPLSILDTASRAGRADDMTAVIMRKGV